jgi:hypothetical protein
MKIIVCDFFAVQIYLFLTDIVGFYYLISLCVSSEHFKVAIMKC